MSATENLDTTGIDVPAEQGSSARSRRLRLLFLVLLPVVIAAIYAHVRLGPYGKGLAGLLAILDRSRARFLAPLDYYRPLYFIDHSLPDDAKVMLFNAQYYYDVGRPGIENPSGSLNTAWRRALTRTDSLSSLHEHLKSRGVTHILVSKWNFNGVENEEQARQAIRNALIFKSYGARYLEAVGCDLCGMKYSLYRLK
ncbi:MAG: hypothetical protein L0229_14405 [Blastocatellia bacterium]|nr:hypothetical protein [Blastocatellia bacterium]